MPDDFVAEATVVAGDTFAADDVGPGVLYPRGKFTLGKDGQIDGDVSDTNPMPSKLKQDGADASPSDPIPFEFIVAASPVSASNPVPLRGDVASGSAEGLTGPVKWGGVARASEPAAVDDGDVVDFYCDEHGRLVVLFDSESTFSVTTLPDRIRTTDSIATALATDSVASGLTQLPVQFAIAELLGDGEILAAVTDKKIRVVSMEISPDGDSTMQIKSGGSGGTPVFTSFLPGNQVVSTGFHPNGLFESGVNENLHLDQGTPNRDYRINLGYVEVD